MKNLLLAIFCVAVASCGDTSQDTTEKGTAKTETTVSNQNQEETIPGKAEVQIGEKSFEIEDFRKNKTDINFTKSQTTIRLTNSEDDRNILINLQGPSLYGSKPATFEPTSTATGEDKATITFIGFTENGDVTDQILLKEGEVNVSTLEEDDSPELELSFSGSGGPNKDFKNEESQPIKGKISIEFDGKVDLRNGQ